MTKDEVHYREGDEVKQCSRCVHFQPPQRCSEVVGKIERTGLCDLFKELIPQDNLDKMLFGGPNG